MITVKVKLLPSPGQTKASAALEFQAESAEAFVKRQILPEMGLWLNDKKTDWVPFTRIERVWQQ